MSTEEMKPAKGEDTWAAMLLPIAVTVLVSVTSTMTYMKFFGQPAPAPEAPKVMVFALADWISELPENSSEEQMAQHFAKGREAARLAAKEGYIVLDAGMAIASPPAARLTPSSEFVKQIEARKAEGKAGTEGRQQ